MSAEPSALSVPRTRPIWRQLAGAHEYLPPAVRHVFWPFVLSRLLVIVILACTPLMQQGLADHWGSRDNMNIRISPKAIAEGFRRVAIGNDAAFYHDIAANGYEERPFDTSRASTWAFFPLHPMMWRGAANITGEWLWSGVVLVNLLAFAAFCLLWSLARAVTASVALADYAVIAALCWPSTYFMMLPHSEALFFALVTAAFLGEVLKHPLLSPVIGAFASAARVNGAFLAPALLVDRWYRGERRARDLMPLGLIGMGLGAYMAYLWHATGNPFAFKDIQVIWGRSLHAPWIALFDYINRPLQLAEPWNPKIVNFAAVVVAGCSMVTCWKRGWRGLAVFTGLIVLAPLSTGTLTSMYRYVSVAPGVYIALAVWAESKPRFGMLWLATSVFALTLLCTLFTLGIDIGGA